MTPRYLTLTVNPEAQLLERTALRDKLLALLQSAESRWIVVHGESGIGKSTLANACFHEADKRDLFGQFGWVTFTTNLPKSIVKAVSNWEPKGHLPKNEAFYEQAAREEVLQLRNYDTPQLIILDGVPDETAMLDYLDLIEIRKARVLITTRQPFRDPRFLNFRIPPLEDGDVLHFFNKAGLKTGWLGAGELDILRGNAWLMRLLVAQTPHVAEKTAKDFLRRVFDHAQTRAEGTDKVLAVAQGLFEARPPEAAACWTLLQFATLPSGRYDLETMISYLSQPITKTPGAEAAPDETDNTTDEADDTPPDLPDDLDLADFAGCRLFAREWRGGEADASGLLSDHIAQLVQDGWLSEQEGEYSLHDNTIRLLQARGLNLSAWFPELCNCFSINYFTEQHKRLKDNLLYESHLLSWLYFVVADASDGYLGVLAKLTSLYKDMVDYPLELACRLKYLGLIERVKGARDVIECKGELSETYRRLGRPHEAKAMAEAALSEALSKEHSLIGYCQNQLGLVCDDLGEYERARDLLEGALASDLKNFGPDHPTVAVSQSNLANVYLNLGQYERARDLLEGALASDLKNFGPDHPTVAVSQSNLANVYRNLGQYERARDLLEGALASDLKNFGPDHPTVAVSQSNLANVYDSLGQYERARDLLGGRLSRQ
ncbi:MAG: tetratricopeptide repeat protein [Saprospiraceae bacterium]